MEPADRGPTSRVVIALAVLMLASLAAGCGSSSGSGSQTTTQAADAGSTVPVVMKRLDFNPTSVAAKVGQRVLWTNEDNAPHNVTYVSGPPFKSSRLLRPGARFSLRLTQPGTIHYYCTIHPWMRAAISVSP